MLCVNIVHGCGLCVIFVPRHAANIFQHAYWNLSGNGKRSVREHGLMMLCDRYLPLDNNQVSLHTPRVSENRQVWFTARPPIYGRINWTGGPV